MQGVAAWMRHLLLPPPNVSLTVEALEMVDLAHPTETYHHPSMNRLQVREFRPGVASIDMKRLQRKQCVTIYLHDVSFIFTYHISLHLKIGHVVYSEGKWDDKRIIIII